jgi:hypothetical protein
MFVWLLLAAVIGGGAALLLWRRRSRAALAGGPEFDHDSAPEPAPAPSPPPPPQWSHVPVTPLPSAEPPSTTPPRPAGVVASRLKPQADAPKPAGVVSSRLRPWVDLNFTALACDIEPDRLVIHFDIEMLNSGSSAARDLLVEVSLFNAGPTQQQDIAAFFERPPGPGERIPGILPLKNLSIRNSIVVERSNITPVELGGKQVYVPVVAFNVHYRGTGGEAQSSASYLVGRDTGGDKLGPLQLVSGPRQVTGLGVRPLPIAVRR